MMPKFNASLLLFLMLLALAPYPAGAESDETSPGRTMARQAVKGKSVWSTTDHSKHEALKKAFTAGSQITDACLSCHSEVAAQFHDTIHWTWLAKIDAEGKQYGKGGDSVNNFCISTNRMADKSCSDCHPGWNGKEDGINCLVCHGQKELKWGEIFEDLAFFMEDDDPESKEIAEEIQTDIHSAVVAIARPTRKNCGSCHFTGGGGDGVKHGDLDTSLTHPSKTLDVHMGIDGEDFTCTRCHTTTLHHISGRVYTAPAATDRKSLIENDLASRITCESCHTATPHSAGSKANDHTDKVACQSCHIPDFARINPTKVSWDWSKAGKLKNGKPYTTEDEFGQHDYMSIKGQMKWEKHVKPHYFWYNGTITSLTVKDVIDPLNTVQISHPEGSRDDSRSRIYPFKIHTSIQPYDKINNTLLAPMLSGEDGYWTTFDFERAFKVGMKYSGMPYSGQYDFVETTYVLPTTHMVTPKQNVVNCIECHINNQSRLANLTSFYMPGRDHLKSLDVFGWMVILLSALGVALHGAGRNFFKNRNKAGENDEREDE